MVARFNGAGCEAGSVAGAAIGFAAGLGVRAAGLAAGADSAGAEFLAPATRILLTTRRAPADFAMRVAAPLCCATEVVPVQ